MNLPVLFKSFKGTRDVCDSKTIYFEGTRDVCDSKIIYFDEIVEYTRVYALVYALVSSGISLRDTSYFLLWLS